MIPMPIVADTLATASNLAVIELREAGPSFTVVALMREEPFIVNRFIEFYLRSGANEVQIYFDGILSDRGSVLNLGHPRVKFIECTDAFWQANCGTRPESLELAQVAIYNIALSLCSCDWMLIVDSDEFVNGPRSIRSLLSSVPEGIDSVRIQTAEAVWGPGDDITLEFGSSHFRTALPRFGTGLLTKLLYGRYAPLFRAGMLGHTAGKHFLRRDARIDQVGIHFSNLRGQAIGVWAHQLSSDGAQFVVAHFDAIGFDRWTDKWSRRIANETVVTGMSDQRIAQMKIFMEAMTSGEDSLWNVFRAFHSINRWQYLLLTVLARVVRAEIFDSLQPHHSRSGAVS